ncbi:MAG TPA: hypothetical protein VF484_05580, partial [Candidatus Limnocylindrales bacterium]
MARVDEASSGAVLSDDEQPADRARPPTDTALGDPVAREPDLLVVLPKRRLDRCELRLDLEDCDRSATRVEAQQVDAAAFAELGVGHLRDHLPAQGAKPSRGGFDERRMPIVEEPIEVAGTPPDDAIERCVEGGEHRADEVKAIAARVAALDIGDGSLAASGPSREIELPPPSATSQRSADATDSRVIHAAKGV